MLRVSAGKTGRQVDLHLVNGNREGDSPGLPFAAELVALAEAAVQRDEQALGRARHDLLERAGGSVLVDAAGVIGNFQRMVRIADCTGIPVDEHRPNQEEVRDLLNLWRFPSAKNTDAERTEGG